MNKFLTSFLLLFSLLVVYGQQREIRGTVVDDQSVPLPGASVVIQGTGIGVSTDFDGNFTISAATGDNLLISYIGFQNQVIVVGDADTYSVQLNPGSELQEVVLTGVAGRTDLRKVSFSVGKVSEDVLQEVPGVNAANALRGKVAGVTVVQGTGLPGVASNIRIRGSSSLLGNQAPLIILDGTILEGSLADINSEDIESMEVLKGSAAAALYGSRAANGVVQIFTKRGSKNFGTSVRIRNEIGLTFIPEGRQPSIAQHHNYKLDSSGQFLLDDAGGYILEEDRIIDNPFPVYYDNLSQFFNRNLTHTETVSLASRTESSTTYIAASNLFQDGILNFSAFGYERQTVRLNHDLDISDKLRLSTSTYFAVSEGVEPDLGAGSPFYDILFVPPHADLSAPNDEDGSPYNWNAQAETKWPSTETNPLYTLENEKVTIQLQRVTANYRLEYDITDYLSLQGAYGVDYRTTDRDFFVDKGWLDTENSTYDGGYISRGRTKDRKDNISATLSLDRDVTEDLNVKAKLSYLYDYRRVHSVTAGGGELGVTSLNDLNNVTADNEFVGSSLFEIVEKSFATIVALDYKDRYLLDFLVRRDGNSLFGSDVRQQTFYRISGAYRISEDFNIPGIQEWKIRASYGTAGLLPPFTAQYETFNISSGIATKSTIGNAELGPFYSAELEIGTNIQLFDFINFEYNYAEKDTRGQVLPVDIPVEIGGFASQWRNAGTLSAYTNEITLGFNWISNPEASFDTTFLFQSTNQIVTDLERPKWQIGPSSAFIIENGKPFGAYLGNQILTSLGDLAPSQDPSKHSINDEGYVVDENGNPVFLLDESGNKAQVQIGDINPDFTLSLNSTFRYKGLSVFMLWDWKNGGNVYNNTKQWTYRELLHPEVDQTGKPEGSKKPSDYYSGLYNINAITSHFVEDASYLKLRELNLSYRFSGIKAFNRNADVRFSLIGRNILQLDNYSGVDPEVTVRGVGDQTNFYFDGFGYPTFTTVTGGLEINF
ncbi:MAG: SusC/RagA family TonB-linked outer membrane protein [Flavobacteriaceae bacterium]|nr:SusC/RagA family TonB-linked outer membrane protein [Flavobacteriaceae bacterium]